MKKRILIIISALLLLSVLLTFFTLLTKPKYADNPEGALIGEYYAEAGDHDLIFVGDCEVYESFVPAVLWERYGISSYVRGSPQQLVWQSYHLLEETFKYETPKAVVFNVLALKYGTPQNEAYNRMTLDGMKWSGEKIDAINASMTEGESMADYVFPLLRFHSRIQDLSGDDLKYLFRAPKVSHSGYLPQTKIAPRPEETSEGRVLSDYTLPETAMEYLDKMRELCREHGTELILIKSPTNSFAFWWYEEWDRQIVEYAEENELAYYNFIPLDGEIGIDWSYDTYDGGVHLNIFGAEKMSDYFGALLSENHGFTDRRGESASLDEAWNERIKKYKEIFET